MSRLAGRMPSGLGLGQRLHAPSSAAAAVPAVTAAAPRRACLALRTVPARYSSTENNPNNNKPRSAGASFQGQLTHSIMKRLQRERAELERVARSRPESTASRNLSYTFGMSPAW